MYPPRGLYVQIEELKAEMEEATEIAEAVRKDLKLLTTRTATLSLDQQCVRCWRPLSDPPAPSGLPSGTWAPHLCLACFD